MDCGFEPEFSKWITLYITENIQRTGTPKVLLRCIQLKVRTGDTLPYFGPGHLEPKARSNWIAKWITLYIIENIQRTGTRKVLLRYTQIKVRTWDTQPYFGPVHLGFEPEFSNFK